LVLLTILSLPNLFVVLNFQLSRNWLPSESRGQLTGNNWSVKNLIENTANYGPELLKDGSAIFFLAVIGIGYFFFRKRKEALFVLVWLVLFWAIYFFSWLQTLGGRTRFYLSFYPGLTVLALYGFLFFRDRIEQLTMSNFCKKFLANSLVSLFIFWGAISVFIFFKNYAYDNSFALDTAVSRLASQDIPKDCAIVSLPHTALGAVSPYKFIDLESFLTRKVLSEDILNKNDCVLFFESLYCSWPGYGFIEQCQEIKNKFNAQIFKTYKIKDARVDFYKISQ